MRAYASSSPTTVLVQALVTETNCAPACKTGRVLVVDPQSALELLAAGVSDIVQNSDLPATSLPWRVQELEACFVVIDNIGLKVAFVYFAHDAEPRSEAKLFSKDEARRIAANVAKLPDLLRR